jgi:hypothetical protein
VPRFRTAKSSQLAAPAVTVSRLVATPTSQRAPLRSRRLDVRSSAAIAVAILAFAASRTASAEQAIIKHAGDHPHYVFEAEPHVIAGFAGPFKDGHAGAGFRGTVVLVQNGFVKTINNSVGLSFGVDVLAGRHWVYVPIAMQWNFWLSTHWSVFGEPGIAIAARDHIGPILMAGGRFHFNDNIALTMRIGYPALSVGVSFLL